MKKNISLVLLAASLMMVACNKMEKSGSTDPMPDNYATIGCSSPEESNRPIEITFTAGHNASECNNSCITENGVPGHADCQGFGNACAVTIRLWPIFGHPKGETFNALVDTVWSLTTEDFFNMPSRSLTVLDAPSKDEMYLNIPAQLVIRDTVTRQFTFTGLYFSEGPVYTNE